MGKPKYKDSPSQKEKQSFAKFLAEDEELVIATGYGANYLRHRFVLYFLFPGTIFILLGLGAMYFLGGNLGYGLLIGLIGASLIAYLKTLLTYHSHRYILTTRRVIIKIGFFNVKLTSALYDKITHMEVDQGLIDRFIMRHGKIIINTAGTSKDEIILEFVDSPVEFKNLLERLINREREQYGRVTGPVTTLEGELVE
ncbi:PH domain-containing protein [Candidatus Daviesbacteria bacterium]|nr:PH domain-containing protein [Candidatus Daviesbacteria bacterium]